ncbi:MAG: leucine-rich repeat protein [Clostridia bacterium]|nr:leucine-rich repeat protein [Clostridia bacterium]
MQPALGNQTKIAELQKSKIQDYLLRAFTNESKDGNVSVGIQGDGYIVIDGNRVATIDSNYNLQVLENNSIAIDTGDDWYYELVGNGKVKLVGYKHPLNGTIVIPRAINDSGTGKLYIVSELGKSIFGFSSITGVDFSNATGLEKIGEGAFTSCEDLVFTLPTGLTNKVQIGDLAFSGCKKFEGNITEILNYGYTLGKAVFMGCPRLTGQIQDVFNQNFYLDSENNPNETEIANNQFSGYSGLTGTLTIPSYITKIGNYAFSECTSISGLYFAENSECEEIGDFAFYKDSGIINSLVFPNSITKIGGYAFYHCQGLTGLILPDFVTYIGNNCFYECSNITGALTIPSTLQRVSDYCFNTLSSLTSIYFEYDTVNKTGCEYIGVRAFQYCKGITSLTLPYSLKTIANRGFQGAIKNINTVTLPYSLEVLGEACFAQGSFQYVEWNECLKTISGSAFWECGSLRNLPSGISTLKTIEGSAFKSCTNLGINDGSGTDIFNWLKETNITSLGTSVFNNCKYIKGDFLEYAENSDGDIITRDPGVFANCGVEIVKEIPKNGDTTILANKYEGITKFKNSESGEIILPNTITSIGAYAFQNCSALKSITINKEVTSIGQNAFYGCKNLTTITFEDGINLSTIPAFCFSTECGLKSISIPSSVTSIEEKAFSSNSAMKSITIPATVESLGDGVFSYNSGIQSIILKEGLKKIGNRCFQCMRSLTSIEIPDSVTQMGGSAFYADNDGYASLVSASLGSNLTMISSNLFWGQTSLQNVTVKGEITSIGSKAFYNCKSLLSINDKNGNTISGTKITGIGENAFYACGTNNAVDGVYTIITISVPNSCIVDSTATSGDSKVKIKKG